MQIVIRSTDKLRGPKALDLNPVLSALLAAARETSTDLARLRVVGDWVQYRQNFREPVDARLICPSAAASARAYRAGLEADADSEAATEGAGAGLEIGVDLRRAASADLADLFRRALNGGAGGQQRDGCRLYLEDWKAESAGCIWAFNALYWRALGLWEQATGNEYEQALPKGESDARNVAAAQELILELFRVWDDLAAQQALPEDLYVLELGVGNGNQARVWLDEFLRLDRERHGGAYYRRLHYLMGDYSPHVLERARANVSSHAEHVSSLVLDARSLTQTLRFLSAKAFLIYISNVYDNLPTDEIVRLGGHLFRVEVRAFIAGATAERLAAEIGVAPSALPDLAGRLLHLGPALLAEAAADRFHGDPLAAVALWRALWEALRLEERYVPIEELDTYEVAPGISGEILRPIVEANGDLRMHVSNGAAASFADSMPLLHPFGVLQCHDLFVTEIDQYQSGFRGPGKYDGSVVNWVNGPLLAAIGRRRGFDVQIRRFAHRSGSNVLTLTARVRE
ncbi:MAG TPA: class I SAM-dependent methyltransferase [Dehalococcoidia bacterium]|nr:class I SAM-dependent methyltransferase [Dehalococcoidia bacterium]